MPAENSVLVVCDWVKESLLRLCDCAKSKFDNETVAVPAENNVLDVCDCDCSDREKRPCCVRLRKERSPC